MEVLGLWFATWRWVSMSPLHLNDGSLEEVTSYSENANCVRIEMLDWRCRSVVEKVVVRVCINGDQTKHLGKSLDFSSTSPQPTTFILQQ